MMEMKTAENVSQQVRRFENIPYKELAKAVRVWRRAIFIDPTPTLLHANTRATWAFAPRGGVFNWSFGQGFLADEALFQQLRAILRETDFMHHELGDLTEHDFSSDHYPTEFLASNVDLLMFTPPGKVLGRVAATANREVRYHPWALNAIIQPTGRKY